MGPIKEEEKAYKYLIYLNDAYKRAIIDSQGQEESSWEGRGKFFECFAVERTGFEHVFSIQPLEM